jgi:hypothetical protein
VRPTDRKVNCNISKGGSISCGTGWVDRRECGVREVPDKDNGKQGSPKRDLT